MFNRQMRKLSTCLTDKGVDLVHV